MCVTLRNTTPIRYQLYVLIEYVYVYKLFNKYQFVAHIYNFNDKFLYYFAIFSPRELLIE